MSAPFHTLAPPGASPRVLAAVWRSCGCADCRRRLGVEGRTAAPVSEEPAAGLPRVSQTRGSGARTPDRADEEALQRQVAAFLDARLPPDCRHTHLASGGLRSKAVAGKLKAAGVRRGAPDHVIVAPHALCGQGATVWLELKSEDGRLSEDQKAWRAALTP
ncbi:MAG: hypothetical protein SF051_11840, partial [Elusimicrobiota bacterium]|nr:hypothetical protein [Elusimicrobiota bacterium]